MPRTCTARRLLLGAALVVSQLTIPHNSRAQSSALTFPADDGRHAEASFELWSGFMHVTSTGGVTYSVLAFFFTSKVIGMGFSGVYGAVLNTQTGKFLDKQDLVTPLFGRADHRADHLDEHYDDNELTHDSVGARYVIRMQTGPLRFRLSLAPARNPVDLGMIVVGKGRTERSYVVPRGVVRGRLRDETGATVNVEGVGMFEHEWGDQPEPAAAEDVLAIHLDDGTDIFALSGTNPDSALVMVASDSADRVLRAGYLLEPDSLATAGRLSFGRRWRLVVGSPSLALRIDPSIEAWRVSLLGMPYLVTRCAVRGNGPDGRSLSGVAYMYVRGRETASGGQTGSEGR